MTQRFAPKLPDPGPDPVARARQTLLEGVGQEVADSFPGITRLGGQIIAALYLADEPRSMDALSLALGRAKSNIFANLRGLEAAGIVKRHREEGERYDTFALAGKYPDVIVGAYLARLHRVVEGKRALCQRTLEILEAADGSEADALRDRMYALARKYEKFAAFYNELLPTQGDPIDLEALLEALPPAVLATIASVVRKAMGRATETGTGTGAKTGPKTRPATQTGLVSERRRPAARSDEG